MDPELWELLEEGDSEDEIAAIVRLGQPSIVPKGVRVIAQFGDIATIRMERGKIQQVRAEAGVTSLKPPGGWLAADLELDPVEAPEDLLESGRWVYERRPPSLPETGCGVCVGVVDFGFDFAHPDFRHDDGRTRILALWDQRQPPSPRSPPPYGYGIVHTAEDINHALAAEDPYAALGYHHADADIGGRTHGTHVASIAAGNGRGCGLTGVAPRAYLVLVHLSTWDRTGFEKLGDSVTLLEAVHFIVRTADKRPWVINLSMGRCGEQHDGTTPIEQGLDAALRAAPGGCIVESGGNYFQSRIHASGQLRPAEERTLVWEIEDADVTPNELEVWYSGRDVFDIEIRSPDGSITARAALGERASLTAGDRHIGTLYHQAYEPNALDNHIQVILYTGGPTGPWELTLIGKDVVDGRFHCWIERDSVCPDCQSRFRPEDAVPSSTTGAICNGFRTIAVGAYNLHSPQRELASFSSSGKTRDGRLKPDLIAPGESILAARSAPRDGRVDVPPWTLMSGTSMATPHVTGTIALMFEAAKRPLRIEETHNLLLANTERVTGPEEVLNRVGSGYLDIARAVEAARRIGSSAPQLQPSFYRKTEGDTVNDENDISSTGTWDHEFLQDIGEPNIFDNTEVDWPEDIENAEEELLDDDKELASEIHDQQFFGGGADKEAYAGDEHEFGRELVELADEVISAGKVHSPAGLLSELLSKAGVIAPARPLGAGHINPTSPAALFDAFTSDKLPGLREYFTQFFDVVASPCSRIDTDLQPGDCLVRRALGEGNLAHVALLVTGEVFRAEALASGGLRAESGRPGLYAEVIDAGPFPHRLEEKFTRRVGDENGQLSHDSLILRIFGVGGPSAESDAAAFEYDAEQLGSASEDYSLQEIADGTLGKLPDDILAAILTNGESDAKDLTDRVFWQNHPDLSGKTLDPKDRKQQALRDEWGRILSRRVKPIIWLRQLIEQLDRHRGDIPREFLLGWIAAESDGRVSTVSRLGERGYFQIMWQSGEAKEQLGLTPSEFRRLSTDREFSIEKGVQLAKIYRQHFLQKYPSVPDGSDLLWRLTKGRHALPTALDGVLDRLVKAGTTITWQSVSQSLPKMASGVNFTLDYAAKLKPLADRVPAPAATPEFYSESAPWVPLHYRTRESGRASFETPEDPGVAEKATGASFVPAFDNLTGWSSIGLAVGGGLNIVFAESVAVSDKYIVDAADDLMVAGGQLLKRLFGRSILDDGKLARVDPADASKFLLRLSGRICYPSDPKRPGKVAGLSPVPVVVLLHGNHDALSFGDPKAAGTQKVKLKNVGEVDATLVKFNSVTEVGNHLGYKDLQKELARYGIASISVDNNLANFLNCLLESRAEILLATLDEWQKQADADPKSPYHGMLDFKNVGFMGHSRGGDAVVRAVKNNLKRTTNQYGVKAVCSLSPTDFTGSAVNAMVLEPADKLTYLVVYGSLDGDVAGWSEGSDGPFKTFTGTGFRHYDRATCQKAMVFVRGACHNRFNTNWGTESAVIPSDKDLLTSDKHLEVSRFYVGGFFRWLLRGETTLQRRFTGDEKPPSGVTIALQWSMGGEVRRIDSFEDATKNEFGVKRVMPFGDVIRFGDLVVDAKPQGKSIAHATKIIDANLMVEPPVSTVLVEELPFPLTPQSDWDAFTYLTFRVGRWFDLTARPFTGDQPHIRVRIKDDDDKEVTVPESEFFTKDIPGKPFLHEARQFDADGNLLPDLAQLTLLRLETVRIPLSLFRIRGVNLKKVRMVAFDLDKQDKTHVLIDSLELVRI